MATDDREQQFERALAKHLRDAQAKACPDAEVLSSYHERTLSLEEMAKWKEHIVGCERCQETLALLEETDSVDAEIWQEQNAVPNVEELAAMPTLRAAAAKVGMREASSLETAAALPAVAAAKRTPRAQWKWIAPIGAVAAGIMVWVGTVEIQKHRDLEAQKSIQVAQNRERTASGAMTDLKASPPAAEPKPVAPAAGTASRDEHKTLGEVTPAPGLPETSASRTRVAPGAAAGGTRELDKKKDRVAGTGFGSGNGVGVPAPAPAAPAARADAFDERRSDRNALAKESGVTAGAAANTPTSRVRPAPPPAAEKSRVTTANKQAGAATIEGLSTITGTVLDPSGAAIGGAVVTAVDTASGNAKTAVADDAGKFTLTDLPSDQYRVVVAHSGFAKSEQTLTLAPKQSEELKIQLKVGATTETVEVAGAAADSVMANSVSSTALETLPANGRGVTQLAQLSASDPRYIVAPDQKLAWRVGDNGKIERSTDRGKTWKPQSSGVGADLRTGSATSDKVCWVIGKAGTILLTTDGGRHWKMVTSPISEDLGGIHAADAQHATIWDIPNRKSFETADGGATWTRTAN